MNKFIILCLSILLLSGCGVSQATFGDAITEGEPTPFPTNVVPTRPIYDVQRGDIIDQRTYHGRVSAINADELHFSIDGQVIETYFSAGDDVNRGDLLAQIDTTQLESQLLDAQEALAVAQSILDSAEGQIDFARRQAELEIELAQTFLDYANLQAADPPTAEDTLLISQRQIELELKQLALEQLEQGVDPSLTFDVSRAQEQVDAVNALIGQAVLVAPMDGNLTAFTISAGDTVVAFESVGIVSDLSGLEVTDVMENAELSELTEGLPVVLQRANTPDAAFEGTIEQLPQPFGSGSDGLVHVRFEMPSSASEFELGERMSFVVTIAERQDVLWLPMSAIRQFSGRNFVVIQEEGVERRVDVQLGLEGNDRVEILEGLEENQRVFAP